MFRKIKQAKLEQITELSQTLYMCLQYIFNLLQLCMEITERYWPLMTQHPNIGTNLSQAELYRTHFKSLLYDPAKVIHNIKVKRKGKIFMILVYFCL